MDFDFVLINVRTSDRAESIDLGIRDGMIVAMQAGLPRVNVVDGKGCFAFSGFVDCHIHLDKAEILDRCPICAGTLEEAVSSVKAAKSAFTEVDVYRRGASVLDQAISHGTTRMRSFVEVDAAAGLRSLHALIRLRENYAHAIDLQICAFAQDGTSGIAGSVDLLAQALQSGADLVGGCPYTDADPARHVADLFDLAERFDTDIDFHVDFSLDPERSDLACIIAETAKRNYARRTTLGHATNLSMLAPDRLAPVAIALADAGIAVVALPATDLFLMGRSFTHARPRAIAPLAMLATNGVTTAIASNNVLNPFTPFGDANLMRMADLYLHTAQLGTDAEVAAVFELITTAPARIMGRSDGLVIGGPATFVLLDAADPVMALRRQTSPRAGWYRGRQTFFRAPVQLLAGAQETHHDQPN